MNQGFVPNVDAELRMQEGLLIKVDPALRALINHLNEKFQFIIPVILDDEHVFVRKTVTIQGKNRDVQKWLTQEVKVWHSKFTHNEEGAEIRQSGRQSNRQTRSGR